MSDESEGHRRKRNEVRRNPQRSGTCSKSNVNSESKNPYRNKTRTNNAMELGPQSSKEIVPVARRNSLNSSCSVLTTRRKRRTLFTLVTSLVSRKKKNRKTHRLKRGPKVRRISSTRTDNNVNEVNTKEYEGSIIQQGEETTDSQYGSINQQYEKGDEQCGTVGEQSGTVETTRSRSLSSPTRILSTREVLEFGANLSAHDVILNLNVPKGLSTIIQLKELCDLTDFSMLPTSNTVLSDCIEELILYSFDLSPRKRRHLWNCFVNMNYYLFFIANGKTYVFDEKLSVRYLRHCMRMRTVPNLFVDFSGR